jgi:hypothetical protein
MLQDGRLRRPPQHEAGLLSCVFGYHFISFLVACSLSLRNLR